jgi:hypothetical protein
MLALSEPPQPISAPSVAKPSEIEHKVNPLTLLDTRAFLDACVLLHDMDGGATPAGVEFMSTLYLLQDRDSTGKPLKHGIEGGLFRVQFPVPRKELLHTSVLAAKLAELHPQVGGMRAHVLHQVPDRSSAVVDVCLYVERKPTVWVPVCLFEFGVHCSLQAKHTQTLAYAVNVCPQLLAGDLFLAVEVILDPTDRDDELGWLRVNGVRHGEPRLIRSVLLWEGPLNAKSTSRLFAAVDMLAQSRYEPGDSWRPSKNAAIGDGHVWKAYDYRGRKVDLSDRRSPDLSCKFIPGCKIMCQSTDLVVIRYPYLEGTHQPRSIGQWIALLHCVQSLHAQKIVHGDLRLSNVVFSVMSDVVTIIDYDLSGQHGMKKYPQHFNCKIDDGARHQCASAGRLLLYEHDLFALGAMMKMCQPERDEPRWQQAYKRLQEPSVAPEVLEEVIQLLKDCPSLPLVLRDDKASSSLAVEGGPGTGSPEKQ